MAKVSFKRGPEPDNIPIVDGQLIYDTNSGATYTDVGDRRLQTGVTKDYVNQTFAPAIPVTMSGTAVSTDMVSPVEHEVGCRLYVNLADPDEFTADNVIRIFKPGKFQFKKDTTYYISTISQCSTISIYDAEHLVNAFVISDNKAKFTAERDFKGHINFNVPDPMSELENAKKNTMLAFADIPYTPYVPDLTAVTVTRCGTNVLNYDTFVNGVILPDGSIDTDASFNKVYAPIPFMDNDISITLTGFGGNVEKILRIGIYENNGTFVKRVIIDVNAPFPLTTVIKKEPNFGYLRVCYSTNIPKEVLQVEYGDVYTGFNKVPAETFIPNSDGIISGMTSISPNMTIYTNNPNVTVEATYNADTKKYIDKKFAELQAAILSTGGNV